MNTKLTITAITLFAVTMGIGFLTPALAVPPPKIFVCHFDEVTYDELGNPVSGTDDWIVIHISTNAESAHVGIHTDGSGNYDTVVDDSTLGDGNDSSDCLARNAA